ncbi:MAG: SpoIIE family protein phosphatase [Proteobacteria bacterium]|nr:SpoIIE family protein phosphatase [Pseudomonadota bacterium]
MEQGLGRVLVVDDEAVNVAVLRGILVHAGYEVFSAMNGADALAMTTASRPDMILLDVMMPGESGFDVCKKLKADPETAHLPIIFVTSLSDVSQKLTGLELGAVDYITKPYFALEVVARVRSHMDFQRRQGDIIQKQSDRLGQIQAAQRALLVRPDQLPGVNFAVHFVPVLEAGGDFYEVVDFGQGRAAYFLADVSGHDLGASFITSSLKALFYQHAAPERHPAETLRAMNRVLCAITPEETYLTAVHLQIDRERETYALSVAAHPPVLAVLAGAPPVFIDLPGSPLGLFDDVEFASAEGRLRQGDRFFLYTDGLAEGINGGLATSALFRAKLLDVCAQTSDLGLPDVVRRMVTTLVGESALGDDVVLLGVEA